MAFQLAANGRSDREVAEALNEAGYRTTGNRGRNLFTKDTVRRVLTNRFYLGELPDGESGWVPGVHEALIDESLFFRAQQARQANSTGSAKVRRAHRRYSLTGLATCGNCGGRLHFNTAPNGRSRYYCYQRLQTTKCPQRSGMLELIEDQLEAYLDTFELPERLIAELVSLYERLNPDPQDTTKRRREIESRLQRMRDLYAWGDMDREAYQTERDRLQGELTSLSASTDRAALITQAAAFLRDLPSAWNQADSAGKNALARLVFQSVEITADRLSSVVPNAEFGAFFNAADLNGKGASEDLRPAEDHQLIVLRGGSDGFGYASALRLWLSCRVARTARNPVLA